MQSGIYIILNKVNNKCYIGKSVNITRRLWEHKSSLKNNRHYNKHLQSAVNKYGLDNFEFKTLMICGIDKLNESETYFIRKYNSHIPIHGYNMNTGGLEQTEVRDEVKQKISIAGQGEKNWNCKLKDSDLDIIIEELLYFNKSQADIARDLNVTKSAVALFVQNRTHLYYRPEIREEIKNKFSNLKKENLDKCLKLYLQGMSQNKACKLTGVSRNTLRKLLIKNNINTKKHINQFIVTS